MHRFNVYFLNVMSPFFFLPRSLFIATDVLYLLGRTSLSKSHAPCVRNDSCHKLTKHFIPSPWQNYLWALWQTHSSLQLSLNFMLIFEEQEKGSIVTYLMCQITSLWCCLTALQSVVQFLQIKDGLSWTHRSGHACYTSQYFECNCRPSLATNLLIVPLRALKMNPVVNSIR